MDKVIAVTGSTGGLGKIITNSFAALGYGMVFINRNAQKSAEHARELTEKYGVKISCVPCDLSDVNSVKSAASELEKIELDALILNSGIYNVPLVKCNSGYNNVFTVNFLSQYYLARRLANNGSVKKIVPVSSIACGFSSLREEDADYSASKKCNAVYGNSKRFLTYSLFGLFNEDLNKTTLSVAHPGVTLTNMTNHYPKLINGIVKVGIKILFPSPQKAARSIIAAVNESCDYLEWIGPRFFNIWGAPKKKRIKYCGNEEIQNICRLAEKMYKNY